MRTLAQRNKTSNLPCGVSEFRESDKRKDQNKYYMGYGVLVKNNGKSTVKKFRCLIDYSLELTERTKNTAIVFRKYYECCDLWGIRFNFHAMDDWRVTDYTKLDFEDNDGLNWAYAKEHDAKT